MCLYIIYYINIYFNDRYIDGYNMDMGMVDGQDILVIHIKLMGYINYRIEFIWLIESILSAHDDHDNVSLAYMSSSTKVKMMEWRETNMWSHYYCMEGD